MYFVFKYKNYVFFKTSTTALCPIGYAADQPKPKTRFAKEDVFLIYYSFSMHEKLTNLHCNKTNA